MLTDNEGGTTRPQISGGKEGIMGDYGEPGSPSRQIIRAALCAGLGIAVCNCGAEKLSDPGTQHANSCPIKEAKRRAVEILKATRL